MNERELSIEKKEIQQRKVSKSRNLSFTQRMKDGADLFDEGMRWMREFIKSENPEFTEEQVRSEILRRKRIRRRIDDAGFYRAWDAEVPE